MSNIKWHYWVPGLGVALIMHDPGAYLNTREEGRLVLFHGCFGLAIAALVAAWLFR
jgi:hypothetical protein